MRIAVVSSCLYSIPPKGRRYAGYDLGWQGGYGGESQIYSFVRALCRAGVEVELFGVAGSEPPQKGRFHYLPRGDWSDVFLREIDVWKMYGELMLSCDIVHDWSLTKLIHHNIMTRDGRAIMTPWGTGAPPPFYNANCVLWSEFQRQLFLQQDFPESTKYVHGGVEPEMFTPSYEEGNYFLYLSRTHPTKHHEIPIQLAKKLGIRLYLACDTESPDHIYFLNLAQKECYENPNIMFVVDPTFNSKCTLYRNAKALILPSESECFGLVVLEALAHGTPVILSRDGAFPEMIQHGVHGFLCDDFQDYESAVKNIGMIDRRACRRLVEERFSTDRMAREYLAIYEQVIGGKRF